MDIIIGRKKIIIKNNGNQAQDWKTIENGKVKWQITFVDEYTRGQNKFLKHILISLNTVDRLTDHSISQVHRYRWWTSIA